MLDCSQVCQPKKKLIDEEQAIKFKITCKTTTRAHQEMRNDLGKDNVAAKAKVASKLKTLMQEHCPKVSYVGECSRACVLALLRRAAQRITILKWL
jgi:hypothetical protein